MSREPFGYWAIHRTEEKVPPATGLICDEFSTGPLRAVIWSHYQKKWAYNPEVAARFLFDFEKMERGGRISPAEVESLASERFGVPLPSEEELKRICDEGEQAEKPSP